MPAKAASSKAAPAAAPAMKKTAKSAPKQPAATPATAAAMKKAAKSAAKQPAAATPAAAAAMKTAMKKAATSAAKQPAAAMKRAFADEQPPAGASNAKRARATAKKAAADDEGQPLAEQLEQEYLIPKNAAAGSKSGAGSGGASSSSATGSKSGAASGGASSSSAAGSGGASSSSAAAAVGGSSSKEQLEAADAEPGRAGLMNRHASGPKVDGRCNRKGKADAQAQLGDDSESSEGPVEKCEKLEWNAEKVAGEADQVTLNDLRAVPAAKAVEGYKTGLATWSERCCAFLTRQAVLQEFLKAVELMAYWPKQTDFGCMVFLEKVDGKPHYHVVIHFAKRHRHWPELYRTLTADLEHKLDLQCILPGHGIDSRAPPLEYLMVYNGDKELDTHPLKQPHFEVPSSVRTKAFQARAKLAKRPMTDYEAEEWMSAHPDILTFETSAELAMELRRIRDNAENPEEYGTVFFFGPSKSTG